MRGLSQHIMSMTPDERTQVIKEAGAMIRDDRAIVMPTDTLYGVFVRAHNASAKLLDELTGYPPGDDEPRFTLHLADLDLIAPELELSSPVVRRLFSRLLPGPSRVVLAQPETNLARVCRVLNIPRGLIENGSVVALRVPDHPIARAVIGESGVPTIARQLGSSIWGIKGNPGTDASMDIDTSIDHPAHPEPAVVIDDGPTRHQTGSTTVKIGLDGRFEVGSGGAITQDEVLRMLETHILFVCTGNTCRSPMAAAIARSMIKQMAPTGISISVDSAGVHGRDGQEGSPEAIEVLGERGLDLGEHRSKMLTNELIERADVIYTMTPSHAQAVMQMAPGSVLKVFPLDAIHPIADPIGHPIGVYRGVADQLEVLIRSKLEEIVS